MGRKHKPSLQTAYAMSGSLPRLSGIMKPKHTMFESMWSGYGEMSTVQNRCYPLFIFLTPGVLEHIFRPVKEMRCENQF